MSNFSRVTVDQIHPMAVVAQSLDNQWVPPDLLRRMLRSGQDLAAVRSALREQVRGEYIRALVNSPQVVINRAFLYNNPVVFESFLPESPDRDAFLKLLTSGAILQMLVGEDSPIDPPAFLERRETPNFTLLKQGWEAWVAAAEEAHVHSLRFSWEDRGANNEQIRTRLGAAFTRRAQTLVNLYGPSLAHHLGVDLDTALKIKEHLVRVTERCADHARHDQAITREKLYAEFVTVDGKDPALGQYDNGKPFCAEVKNLIDLAYNVNLAIGLETLALTPSEALHRTALQEVEGVRRQGEPLSAAQLAEIIRGTAFDFIQETLFIDTFAKLSLRDVWDLRRSEEWNEYVRRMNGLLADPLAMFTDPEAGAPAVVRSYLDLLGETTRIATARYDARRPNRHVRDFSVVMGVEVAGAVLEYEVHPTGVAVALAGAVAAPLLSEAAKVTVRLGLRAREARRERAVLAAALDTRTQLLTGWVESGGRFWRELLREMDDVPGMDEARKLLRDRAAAMEGEPDSKVEDPLV